MTLVNPLLYRAVACAVSPLPLVSLVFLVPHLPAPLPDVTAASLSAAQRLVVVVVFSAGQLCFPRKSPPVLRVCHYYHLYYYLLENDTSSIHQPNEDTDTDHNSEWTKTKFDIRQLMI